MIRKDVDVMVFLLEQHKDINISSISKSMKMDYKNTHNIVSRLKKQGLLNIEEFGNSSKIKIADIRNPLIYEAQKVRREKILKNKDISTIVDYFERNMKSRFYVMLIFGSYAKRTNTKNSDIDLLFIIPDEDYEKQIADIASMIPLNIHLNVFTEKEFLEMKNSRETTVVSEAIDNNVILHGIEQYCELIR